MLRNASPGIVIALVGNKLDLADSDRKVTFEEGEAYATEANLLFTETSARTGDNVTETFVGIAKKLPRTEQQLASPRLAGMDAGGRRVDLTGAGGSDARGDRSQFSSTSRCC